MMGPVVLGREISETGLGRAGVDEGETSCAPVEAGAHSRLKASNPASKTFKAPYSVTAL